MDSRWFEGPSILTMVGSNTILRIKFKPNSFSQNRFVRWELSSLIYCKLTLSLVKVGSQPSNNWSVEMVGYYDASIAMMANENDGSTVMAMTMMQCQWWPQLNIPMSHKKFGSDLQLRTIGKKGHPFNFLNWVSTNLTQRSQLHELGNTNWVTNPEAAQKQSDVQLPYSTLRVCWLA